MDTASILFKEFASSAPIIGAEKPVGAPEQGLYRLQEAMQEHFAHILKAVLHGAYGMDTVSEQPAVEVRPGHPYQNDLFVDIFPRDGIEARVMPLVRDINHLKQHFAVDAGMDPERGLVLRFRAEDMKKALGIMIHHYDMQADERIARHMFAISHLIDRSGGPDGYTLAHRLS